MAMKIYCPVDGERMRAVYISQFVRRKLRWIRVGYICPTCHHLIVIRSIPKPFVKTHLASTDSEGGFDE